MEKNNPVKEGDLSSATPADTTAHPTSNPVLKTPTSYSFQKVVCLDDWWLVKSESNCGGKRLAVEGRTMKWQQPARVFLSSPIVKRHDAFTLETADGVTVMIQGLINRSCTHQNGFPPEACNKFLMGFPYNWEIYVNQYFGEEPTTQNIPSSASCFAEQQRSSVNDACSVAQRYFDKIPMSRILEYLISTHGNSDKGKMSSLFAEILGNCTGDASKNPMMQNDSHIEISTSRMGASSLKETSSMTETTKSHPKHDNSTATGYVAPVDDDYGDYVSNCAEEREGKNDKDTKDGGPETSRKVLSSEELGNKNHGSHAELKNDVVSRSALMENSESTSTDAPEQVNQVQTGVDARNTIPYENLEDLASNVIKTAEHKSHGSSLDVAKDGLEEGMHVASSKNHDNSGYSKSGLQLDGWSSHCGIQPSDQNESLCSSVEPASNSNISAKVQESNDKAKRRPRKYKKTIVVNQPIITRDRAKKLSIVSPESLNIKRSRSGRLLLPVLANWRNEQPIYDLDGTITGITLDVDRALPPTGSKSEPAKKRKKQK